VVASASAHAGKACFGRRSGKRYSEVIPPLSLPSPGYGLYTTQPSASHGVGERFSH
jgi:hypothetical protein